MIKLNNKNITYVALADSNNSLKAPKEIWYADSNNSVKLVYRRKDALIEGEDYEKYHWLKGDGNSYINTLKLIESDSEVRCVIIPTSDSFNKWKYIYANDPSDTEITFMCVLLKNNSTLHFRHKRGNVAFTINTEYECVHSIDSVKVNNEVLTPVSESEFQENNVPLYLFNAPTISGTSDLLFDGYIKYVTLSDKLNLIPCKLLKPVPKWLDANGIRRQVGECGMIDLVSGKFYGNVNSSGTFTVENYYERKEWLQGRNGAYIDTCYKIQTYTDSINGKFRYDGSIRNPDNSQQNLFGVLNADVDIRGYVNSSNKISLFYRKFVDNNYPTTIESYDFTMEMSADVNSGVFYRYINGVNITPDLTCNGLQQTIVSDNMYLFSTNDKKLAVSNQYFHGDIAYFKITDTLSNTKMNLIPCTLTMDLPASMDANNIARTKGTSGMWDLVSDRFYGNVANSGTFKAVNLAEGIDYETHQWLVRERGAVIQGIEYDLWNNHLQLQIGKVSNYLSYIDYSNSDYNSMLNISTQSNMLMVLFRQTLDSVHIADIIPWTSPDVVTMELYIDNSTFYCIQNGVTKVNSPTQSNATSSAWSSIYPQIHSAKMSYIREVLPDSTYKSNLIPVKLLRSIPSKYDANGIARQAGECGMYDTVNDVFYGNVASSGSFTVSDDN